MEFPKKSFQVRREHLEIFLKESVGDFTEDGDVMIDLGRTLSCIMSSYLVSYS